MEKEHHFIDKYLKPLSIKSKTYPIGIGDDCAVIDSTERLITSKDISVSDVHFPKELDPYFIAYRSVAIAISDIFAMGGTPSAYLLGITHPKPNDSWFESFSRGLNDFNNTTPYKYYRFRIFGRDRIKDFYKLSK